MRKISFRFLWLAALPMMLGLAACTDKTDNIASLVDETEVAEPEEESITDDQLSVMVTADLPAAVLRPFDEGSTGAALVRRLQTVADEFAPGTRLVLIPGSMFNDASTMTEDELNDIVRLSLDGGYLAIERPTGRQLFNFAVVYIAKLIEMQELEYKDMFGLNAPAAAREARSSQLTVRTKERLANTTRATNQQAAVRDIDDVQAEMIIYGPTDYFMQQPFEEQTIVQCAETDGEGNATAIVPQTVSQQRTAATSGQLADAAARWLNDVANTATRHALTRAAGSSDTSELLQSEETFTYNGLIYFSDWKNTTQSRSDRLSIKVSSRNVHNMEEKKDYYYLNENVLLSLGTKEDCQQVFYPKGDKNWIRASGDGTYNCWFGAYLTQYATSMNLTGSGNISIATSSPTVDNDDSQDDLTLSYQADGSCATWTYNGAQPKFYVTSVYCHGQPAAIQVGDVNLTHEICWAVSNPSGSYTVEVTSAPTLSALMIKSDGTKSPPYKYVECSDEQSYTQQLLEPARAFQTWRMSIEGVEYEDTEQAGSVADLERALMADFPDIYVPEFQIGDSDDASLSTISTIINESKSQFALQSQHLTELARRFGMKKFEIVWTRQGSNQIKTTQAFVYYVCPKATEATTAHLGWVYGSDGTLYPSADYARGWNATAVGIVAYVNDGSDFGDRATEKASGAGHGLVLALRHTTWADVRIIHSVSGIFESTVGNSMDNAKSDFDGLAKTQSLAAKGSYASQTALNYGTTPEGCTPWFIPSTGQWIAMLCQPGLGGAEVPTGSGLNTHFNINGAAKLSSAARANGGSALVARLWTSSGFNRSTGIWLVNGSSPRFTWYNWSSYAWVRPVFAF